MKNSIDLGSDPGADTIPRPSDQMVRLVYRELHQLARARLRLMRQKNRTLQTTALINEAYLRLARRPDQLWQGRRHFYRAAARAMRCILVDRVRKNNSRRHGGDWQRVTVSVTLGSSGDAVALDPEDFIALERALAGLERDHPEHAEIVLMRYYCGLTMTEIAESLGMARSTVDRKWAFARGWLRRALRGRRAVAR